MQVVTILSSLIGRRSSPAFPILARLARWRALLVLAWQERSIRRTIQELNAKDDFMLFDLGIRRDQIEAAVRDGRFDLEPTRHR